MEISEEPTNRRRFVKQIGVALAAAVGAGWLVQAASAGVLCCADTTCPTCTLSGGGSGYLCTCDCTSCAICQPLGQCTACPC